MNPNKIGPEIIEHWYSLALGQQFSVQECYEAIETEVKAQKMPSLRVERVNLAEGGLVSDMREYLRIKRDRHCFDICAAPVGVNFFFSYRNYIEPIVVKLWEFVVLYVVLSLTVWLFVKVFGSYAGSIVFLACCAALVWFMRHAVGLGMQNLDESLASTFALGPVYEKYFRKDTYYRQDLRIAYSSLVGNIVKQEIERVTAAKGVCLVREYEYSPLFKDTYTVKEITRKDSAKT